MSSNQQPPQSSTQSTAAGSQQKPAGLPTQQPTTPQAGGVAANTIPFLGCKISLISKSGIRYEGILHNIDTRNSTVALRMVRMFGTEGRREGQQIPAIDKVFEFISFKGPDIKDLTVCETPAQQSSAPIGTREESPAQSAPPQQQQPAPQALPTNPQFGTQFAPKPFPQTAPGGMMPGQYNPYFQNAFNPFYMQPPMPFQPPTGFPPAGHPISGSPLYKPPQTGAPATSQTMPSQQTSATQQAPQGGQKPAATTAVPPKPTMQPTQTIKAPQPQPQPQIITPQKKPEIVEAKPVEQQQHQQHQHQHQPIQHQAGGHEFSSSSVFDDNRHMLPPRFHNTNQQQQHRGRGRGGFAPRGRGGRGRGRGGMPGKVNGTGGDDENMDEEFDFDAANAKLDKESIKKEMNINEDKETIAKKIYNKTDSFFDNISRESSSESRTREERDEQYRTDTETFGASTVASHKHQQRGHHRGRGGFQSRGRGGFQPRGGRGGPRGGRGGQRGNSGFSQQFS